MPQLYHNRKSTDVTLPYDVKNQKALLVPCKKNYITMKRRRCDPSAGLETLHKALCGVGNITSDFCDILGKNAQFCPNSDVI